MRKNIWEMYCLAMFFAFCIVFAGCKKEAVWNPGTPLPKEKIKVAVIHPYEIDGSSLYDYAHYTGTLEMQRNLGLEDSQIIRKVNVFDGDPAETEGAMRDSIAEGANIILATSWGYMDTCEKLAKEFPHVVFAHATGYKYNDRNFTNYSIRFYQARYLSGIVAGLQTKTGQIGYVAAMGSDNSEVTGGINAFAMGVEEVNPEARVYVRITHSWYDPMGETEAANALIARSCDVISAHCNTPAPQMAAQAAGVWGIGFNSDMRVDAPDSVITSVVLHWGVYYTGLVESVIDGTFRTEPRFYGFMEGAIDITALNEKLAAPGIEAAVEAGRQRLREGFNVFDGVMRTNTGRAIGEEGQTLSDDVILGGIDWYYRNVAVTR